jgi:predicted outer membrane repeat protein
MILNTLHAIRFAMPRLRHVAVDGVPRARSYRATIGAVAALLLLTLIGFIAPHHAAAQQVIYVTESGSGGGTAWSDAADLSSALSSATGSDVVVIAAGTYQPSERLEAGDPRTATFEVTGAQDGVKIYGGWSGTESFSGIADVEAQLTSRDLQAHETVLSGDLGQNDDPDSDGDGFPDSGRADNAYHVLVFNGGTALGSNSSANITPATVLNGVTVKAGYADALEPTDPKAKGAGLFCDGMGTGNACSVQISRVIVEANEADALGGGIYVTASSGGTSRLTVTQSTLTNNIAEQGGALYYRGVDADGSAGGELTVSESAFTNNVGRDYGGAIHMISSGSETASQLNVRRGTFSGNVGSSGGGALYHDVRIDATSATEIINSVFTDNRSGLGGGAVFNDARSGGTSELRILNSTLVRNRGLTFSRTLQNESSNGGVNRTQVTNSILYSDLTSGAPEVYGRGDGVELTLTNTLVEGGLSSGVEEESGAETVDNGTTLTGNPQLADIDTPPGPDGVLGTEDDGLRLRLGSVALDAGSNNAIPATTTTDVLGNPRVQESGTGARVVDLGAYERSAVPAVPDEALLLNGTSDYVSANSVSDALADTDAFTVEAWVYPTEASGTHSITTFATRFLRSRNMLVYRDERFGYGDSQLRYATSRNVFPAGQWYHVALTIDASDVVTLYVNGREEVTRTTSDRPAADGLFSVGRERNSFRSTALFTGRIDEVRVWNEARTQRAIQKGMTVSLGEDNTLGDTFDLSDLVAHYRFEGRLVDETGFHPGTPARPPSYTNDVAQPTAEDALVVRVNADASGGVGNGTSWSDAHTALQDGLTGTGPENEVWIAEGTYMPTRPLDDAEARTATFEITGDQDGLQIYGGFDGTEPTRTERDPAANETILSGDIGTTGDTADNAYHVVVFNGGNFTGDNSAANITNDTVLDGVTITGGNAAGDFGRGGGLLCDGAGTESQSSEDMCSPTLTGLIFADNSAGKSGGAIHNAGIFGESSPVITNTVFTGNSAGDSGGAITSDGSGGGASSPQITNTVFTGNSAGRGGGALYFYGDGGSIAARIANSIFVNNGTDHIAFDDGNAGTSPTIVNSTFTGATDVAFDIRYYDSGRTPLQVVNSILWDNGGMAGTTGSAGDPDAAVDVTYSVVDEAAYAEGSGDANAGPGNLNIDPLFVDAGQPAGPDALFATADDGLRIAGNSPAVDVGDNSAVPGDITTDLIGDPRTQDGNENGTDIVNLGAYETPGLPIASSVTITGTAGTGTDAGWRVLSVPYTGAVAGDVRMASPAGTNAPRFDRDVMAVWDDSDPDESTGGTGAYTTAGASTPLGLGDGLLLYLEDDARDPVAPGGLTVSLDKSTAATRHGTAPVVRDDLTQSARWHLVGNPYPTDYELSALTTGSSPTGGSPLAGNGFKADAQVYDATRGTWAIINTETKTLSAWQGAFIERSDPGTGPTEVTFDPGGRTDASAPFIGSEMQGPTAASEGVQRGTLWLEGVVTDAGGTVVATDQAIGVRFHESAANGWDAWDTSKLAPLEAPSIALSAQGPGNSGGDVAKAVESRPWPQDASDPDADRTAVPVAVQGDALPAGGTLTLQVREWDLPDTWAAELIDTQGTSTESDDQTVPLEPGMGYPVDVSSLSATPETERFVVQIAPNTGALPVELARFDAQRSGDDAITVQWQTLSETNNAGFEVQRQANSARGAVGNPTWDAIATLDGAGTTDEPQSYRFEDTDLPYEADSLRYRLRQIDTDGTESFSEPVTIARQVNETELLPTYPNPARGQATVRFAVPNRQNVRINLYDLLGRRVQTVVDTDAEGRTEQTIDVGGLASGTYFLRMQTESHTETQRITVVR